MHRARSGDPLAFEELVRPHVESVRRFAFSFSTNWSDADDVAQEALLKAFRSFRTYDGRAKLSTWLYAVTRNTCADWYRSRVGKPRPLVELDDELPDSSPRPEELLGEKRNAERLWEQVGALPEQFRSVLVLFDIEGVPYEEIAAIEGIPIGTVRSRLSRARAQLADRLEAEVVSPLSSPEPTGLGAEG